MTPKAPLDARLTASAHRRRGPKPDLENHAKVLNIISRYGEHWTADENLSDICEALDRHTVPVPKTWPMRNPPSRSWSRALQNEPGLVIKAIKDRCKAAPKGKAPKPQGNSRQLPLQL